MNKLTWKGKVSGCAFCFLLLQNSLITFQSGFVGILITIVNLVWIFSILFVCFYEPTGGQNEPKRNEHQNKD